MYSQNLTIGETIKYINSTELSGDDFYKSLILSVDNNGIIKIEKIYNGANGVKYSIATVNYKDVYVRKTDYHPFKVILECKKGSCIKSVDDNDKTSYWFLEYIKISDDKLIVDKIYNATDYLLKLLKENIKVKDDDPFSPSNYNK